MKKIETITFGMVAILLMGGIACTSDNANKADDKSTHNIVETRKHINVKVLNHVKEDDRKTLFSYDVSNESGDFDLEDISSFDTKTIDSNKGDEVKHSGETAAERMRGGKEFVVNQPEKKEQQDELKENVSPLDIDDSETRKIPFVNIKNAININKILEIERENGHTMKFLRRIN